MKFRKHFDYDLKKASDEAAIAAEDQGVSLTVQSHTEDVDINILMKRFGVTGQLPSGVRVPEYGDFTQISDYRSALHAIMEAEESFMAMPAEVRAEFHNDPQEFLVFCDNPANLPRMRELGLAVTKESSDGSSGQGGSGSAGSASGGAGAASGGGAGGNAGAA